MHLLRAVKINLPEFVEIRRSILHILVDKLIGLGCAGASGSFDQIYCQFLVFPVYSQATIDVVAEVFRLAACGPGQGYRSTITYGIKPT
jgi:hypothetical protein